MDTCPNGYICINHFQAIILIIVVLAILYSFNNENYRKLFSNKINHNIDNQSNKQINDVNNSDNQYNKQINDDNYNNMNQIDNANHDKKVISNPLYPPLQRGIPINIETRESGGDYQQLGILSKNTINNDDKTPGNNTDTVVLPLYGKPTYKGSNKWLYYTETDKLNPVKIPVTYKNKDCTDDYGCEELYNGDTVLILSYNGDFTVKIYKLNKPRYIPF